MYIVFALLVLGLLSTAYAGLSLIVWVPTRRADLPRILKLADPRPNDIIYELGCGDGRVAAFLAEHSSAKIIGLELAWPFYLISKARQLLVGQNNLAIRCHNLFKTDLSDASTVYVFGIPGKLAEKLRPKLERELKPGAKVISYGFAIAGWQPEVMDQPSGKAARIFVYRR
jgi:SAM-dependent methyltransferase